MQKKKKKLFLGNFRVLKVWKMPFANSRLPRPCANQLAHRDGTGAVGHIAPLVTSTVMGQLSNRAKYIASSLLNATSFMTARGKQPNGVLRYGRGLLLLTWRVCLASSGTEWSACIDLWDLCKSGRATPQAYET